MSPTHRNSGRQIMPRLTIIFALAVGCTVAVLVLFANLLLVATNAGLG